MVLFHLLAALRAESTFKIQAIHVNHGLSPHADRWEAFCSEASAASDVDFTAVPVRLARMPGESLEALARKARYAALEGAAAAAGVTVIALAQHTDDQAETVLLQMLRGAAAQGLAAMAEWRRGRTGFRYWRPLLAASRRDIVEFARRHGLRWIEDESNEDPVFKRNFLRTQVLPRLEVGFPGYRASLARVAAHAAEAAQLLDQLAEQDAATALEDGLVTRAALVKLGTARAGNLLRWILRRQGHPVPPAERLSEFIRQAIAAKPDRHPALQLGPDAVLRAEGPYVVLDRAHSAEPFETTWHGESVVALPHGSLLFALAQGTGVRAELISDAGLVIRARQGGERLQVAANRPLRTLKNLMQEVDLPAAVRKRWPLIVHGESVVAVPGIGVGVDWQCPPGEPGWTIQWHCSTLDKAVFTV